MLLVGKKAVGSGWDTHWSARLNPSKSHPGTQGRVPVSHSLQLCSPLVPWCHLRIPVWQHRYTSSALQLRRKLFTFSVRLVFPQSNKWAQLPVQLHKHQRQGQVGAGEPLSAVISCHCTFRWSFNSFLLHAMLHYVTISPASKWHTMLKMLYVKSALNLGQACGKQANCKQAYLAHFETLTKMVQDDHTPALVQSWGARSKNMFNISVQSFTLPQLLFQCVLNTV